MRINRKFLALCRTIHIYLTMLGLFVMLGFGITGFTAYHEDWFDAAKTKETTAEGSTPLELIDKKDSLQIIQHVRKTFAIKGAMISFHESDDEYSIAFASPGMDWTATVTKETGKTVLKRTVPNLVAVINDLHRGRSSGRAWGWVIDLSAGLIVLACITGVVLWLALPKRLKLGIAFMFAGTAATVVVFYLLVPGPDKPAFPAKASGDNHSSPSLFGASPDTAPATEPDTQPASSPESRPATTGPATRDSSR